MRVVCFLVIVVSFFACKKTPVVLPVDPCQEFIDKGGIGFKILENPAGNIEYETDTIYTNSTVIFQANPIYLNVKWKIAYDPRTFTNRRQSLRFTQLPTDLLPVTMIGFRGQYPGCVPNDDGDGYDTITKYFFIVDAYKIKPLGTYFGKPDHDPQDTSTIKIAFVDYGPGNGYGEKLVIQNFPRNNCGNIPYRTGIQLGNLGYRFFDVGGGFDISITSQCNYPNSIDGGVDYFKGFMPTKDSLIIDMKTIKQPGGIENWYKWRGRKYCSKNLL